MSSGRLLIPNLEPADDGFTTCLCGIVYSSTDLASHDCVSAWRDAYTDLALTLERERVSASDLRWALRMCESEVLRLRGDLARALAVLT